MLNVLASVLQINRCVYNPAVPGALSLPSSLCYHVKVNVFDFRQLKSVVMCEFPAPPPGGGAGSVLVPHVCDLHLIRAGADQTPAVS